MVAAVHEYYTCILMFLHNIIQKGQVAMININWSEKPNDGYVEVISK